MGFERGPLLLMIKPRRLLGQVLRVVKQLDGLARALGWRYGAGFLGQQPTGASPISPAPLMPCNVLSRSKTP